MTDFHRTLAMTGSSRPIGKAITGAATLACFSLFVTGIVIWLPKRWSWKAFQAIAIPNINLSGRARDWNWHNAVGFWLSPAVVVITVTGIIMAYGWADNLFAAVVGIPPQERRADSGHESKPGEDKGDKDRSGGGDRGKDEDKSGDRAGANRRQERNSDGVGEKPAFGGVDEFLSIAEETVGTWKSLTFRLPLRDPVQFRVDQGNEKLARLLIDRGTGEVLHWEADSRTPPDQGRQWRLFIRNVHTGQWGGIFGETLAVLSSLAIILLIWTGLALSWRRFFRKGPRKEKESAA